FMLGCRKPGQWSEQVDQSKLLYISYKNLVKALPRAVLAAYSCLLAHREGLHPHQVNARQTAGVHHYRRRGPSQACTERMGRRMGRPKMWPGPPQENQKGYREGAASKVERQVGSCTTKRGGGRTPTPE